MPSFRMTKRAATGVWLMFWGVVAWWAAISALPHNPQSPGLSAERGTRIVIPEGWGFFTRNPREPDLIIARRGPGDIWRIEPPHASMKNLFGLDRTSRALPVESMRILSANKPKFGPCTGSWADCLDRATPVPITNGVDHAALCGDVGLLWRAPPPWAWAGLMDPEDMPTEFVRLEIECPHEHA